MSFTTETFRQFTSNFLKDTANPENKFNELIRKFFTELHQRDDLENLRRYSVKIYDRIRTFQPVQWKNSSSLNELTQPKIVILYFWNLSNVHVTGATSKINFLTNKYRKFGLTSIGIHLASFQHEAKSKTIRQAIDEQSIVFDVINDDQKKISAEFDLKTIPTAMVFAPDALPLFIFEGEDHFQHIETFLLSIIENYESMLNIQPETFSPIDLGASPSNLSKNFQTLARFKYPTNICFMSNGKICVSFASSNQLLLCQPDGKVLDIIGNGHAGLVDGDLLEAEFHSPHGLVEFHNCIYVADTNNHAIRVFDLNSRRVLTLIGTGRSGTDRQGGMKGLEQPICSPWDLCIAESPFDNKSVLLIAMAGANQIWLHAFEETRWWNNLILTENSCSAIVGSGVEGNLDSLDPKATSFCAPRAICNASIDGQRIIFLADSGNSMIRFFSLLDGTVKKFDFNVDSPTQSLEFPAGIGFHFPTARLIIADTFNNALQCVDTRSCVSSTFYRTEHYFSEPFGVAVSDESIFIADKNNFEIKRIDLKSGSLNRTRFDFSQVLGPDRIFNSKQTFLKIELPEQVQLDPSNTSTWTIEDRDGFKISDGQMTRRGSDPILLDYIPRDKEIGHLKYELVLCNDENLTTISGTVSPSKETENSIDFLIKLT